MAEQTGLAERVITMLQSTEALLSGHFLLTSGLHSARYVQCAKVLQYPQHAEALGAWIAERFRQESIQAVISPAIGGIILGQEVARGLGVRAIFGEREQGVMTLRRGFDIAPGERLLVVEDVTTTGGSVREVIQVVRQRQGIVVGVGAILDRSGGALDFGAPFRALASLQVVNYTAATCPMCQQGSVPIKPGSRATP